MLDRPRILLRAEGLALLLGALVLYFHADFSWLLLVVLFLAPDVSFAAYLAGPSIGAAGYNLVHTMVLPIGLGVVGVLADSDAAQAGALIWLAHIGIDRLLGYGLKYPTAFKDTHLQRV
jgi:hypothetical protein